MSDRKLVIFDFDGTLVNSQIHFDVGLTEFSAMKSLPHDLKKMEVGYVDPLKYDLGWGLPLEAQPAVFAELVFYLDDQVINHQRFIPDLYDNVREVLDELQTEFDLGIITARSRSTMLATLQYHKLEELFPVYRTHCCTKERNYQLKPSADALHCLLKDTKHAIEDIVVIGDTTSDIGMANAAGAKSIGVLWGAHSEERLLTSSPTLLIQQVNEIPNAIREVFKNV